MWLLRTAIPEFPGAGRKIASPRPDGITQQDLMKAALSFILLFWSDAEVQSDLK